jgi:hypothetical protein
MKTPRQGFRALLIVAVIAATLVPTQAALSQTSIEDAIRQFGGDNITGYVQPIVDFFGANMNSGYYHSAAIPKSGFGFSFELVAMGALVKDEQKTFTANTPAGFTPGTFSTATVFGGKGTEVTSTVNPLLKYRGADGVFNTSIFPQGVPQIRIGSIQGTEALVRFVTIPKIGGETLPKTTLWAAGLRHSLSQWIPDSPLDLAVGVYYGRFTAGDIIESKEFSVGVQASKSLSILTVYGGLAVEKSTMDLNYTSSNAAAAGQVSVSIEGANKFRATAGAALSLGFFHLFADANFGTVMLFSGGIGFGM